MVDTSLATVHCEGGRTKIPQQLMPTEGTDKKSHPETMITIADSKLALRVSLGVSVYMDVL